MKCSGLTKGLIAIGVLLAAIVGCKQSTEDAHTLAFKQKEANAYLEFLAAHPDSAGLRLLTAQKLDSVGRYQEALLQMDTLLSADSTKYGLWMVKASILLDSTDSSAALTAINRALTHYKGEEALLAKAGVFALSGNDSCLQIAGVLANNPVYSNYINGLYAVHQMDTALALKYLQRSIQMDPSFADAYVALARLYLKSALPEKAKNVVVEGLTHNDHSIHLLNMTGIVFEHLHQPDSAKTYYQKSLFIKPYQPELQQKIAAAN